MAGKQARGPEWLASDARHRFSEVVDAAAGGTPQFVRRRDGQEVVVVSKEYFERTRPTLKSVLLNFGFEHGDGSFDEALREARKVVGRAFMPRESAVQELINGRAGHRRAERAARRK